MSPSTAFVVLAMVEGDIEHAYSAEVRKRECEELQLAVAEVNEAKV